MDPLLLREDQEKWEIENLSQYATKSIDASTTRWKDEEPDPFRTCFQRDVGRILYSNAFRRLRTKTQVFCCPNNQHNRTRLTHSLEVSHLARQMSRTLRLNIDLTEAIALGHDLGHTPFGHAGERALNSVLKGKGGFCHNVQSLWIVEKTYPGKIINGKPIKGFNLTIPVREGILKHTDIGPDIDTSRIRHFKLDKPASLEGQVVDICDGLAYLYHDIKDGQQNSILTQAEIIDLWRTESGSKEDDWLSIMIKDIIENSYEKEFVNFSPAMESTFIKIKKYVQRKILNSEIVKKGDERGFEMVTEMFHLYLEHEDLLPNTTENKFKKNDFGIERVIVDYIQWLGDQNFEVALKSLKYKINNKVFRKKV